MVQMVMMVAAVALVGVVAEPPSPRRYLPPGQHGYQQPSSQYGAPSSQYNAPSYRNGGYNSQDDDLAEPANYEFEYVVRDDESGNDFGHQESRQGDEARGSYHVVLPDGRKQIVDYVANNEGYMPTIRYEEGQGGYPSGPNGGQGGYPSGPKGEQRGFSGGYQGRY